MTREVLGCECVIRARGAAVERDAQYVKRDLLMRTMYLKREPMYLKRNLCV